MADLEELYRQVILDHYRNPRRRGKLSGPHVHAEGLNPSCGDEFVLDLLVEDGVVVDAAIDGQGCSISQASGSMMTDAIVGKTVEEGNAVTEKFRLMMEKVLPVLCFIAVKVAHFIYDLLVFIKHVRKTFL